ncbi:MAG: polysaccharide biosynthesis/export family protein [Betaproteobacteria bacterium]|nr:polysaccharide biosynthesis/export family protein [Betaproteobacteria bacterium]
MRAYLPILVLATYLLAGCASVAPVDAPRTPIAATPVATTFPLQSVVGVRQERLDGPMPIALDAPRVSPPATGQTVAEDYRIGPQDLIEVQVYGLENLKREVRVNSRGVISLPLIGTVALGGLTAQEGEELITVKYEKDYLRKGQTSLLQARAIAGGGASMADMNAVMLFRVENGSKKSFKFDVPRIRAGELADPVLMNDDLVVVNRSPARTALRDSLFRDVLDTINPFNYLRPY